MDVDLQQQSPGNNTNYRDILPKSQVPLLIAMGNCIVEPCSKLGEVLEELRNPWGRASLGGVLPKF